MNKKFIVKLICIFWALILSSPLCFANPENKAPTIADVDTYIEKILQYKKAQTEGYIIDKEVLDDTFNFIDAKLIVALTKNNTSDNFTDYTYVLVNKLKHIYDTNTKLNKEKAATGAQAALTLLACGINPHTIELENGNKINFLADTIYKRDSAYPIGKDGVEGYAWGLIALNAYKFDFEEEILPIKETFLSSIVDMQLPDGTFSPSSSVSPYYLTALSVIALAPEYDNSVRKNEIRNETLEKLKKADEKRRQEGERITFEQYVKEQGMPDELTLYDYIDTSVDKSLEILSKMQSADGSYSYEGDHNISITSAVITALCTMDINPAGDQRFTKNSNTLLDGLLKYQQEDGSFRFSETSDVYEDTIDALAALVSYKLYLTKKGSFYDFKHSEFKNYHCIYDVSDKDIENIVYINRNFNLSMYPYVCIVHEKLLDSNRSDKQFLLSIIRKIHMQHTNHKNTIDYINTKGKDLLYSESGINLKKKSEIGELLKLCESLPLQERKYIVVYDALASTTKRVENAIALETLLFSVIILVAVSFLLSVMMYFIKKRTLAKKITFYNRSGSDASQSQNKRNVSGPKDKKMPFELEEDFFNYESKESPDVIVSSDPLPFENNEFFEYDYENASEIDSNEQKAFSLPFEGNNDFFEYEQKSEEDIKADDGPMMPFEKEKNFFRYR